MKTNKFSFFIKFIFINIIFNTLLFQKMNCAYAIDSKLDQLLSLEKELHQLELKTAEISSDINNLDSTIKILSSGLAEKKKNLSARLQTFQNIKKQKWSILLKLNDISQFQRITHGLQKINVHDIKTIREHFYKIEEVQSKKKSLVEKFKKYKNLTDTIKNQASVLADLEDKEIKKLVTENKSSLLRYKGTLQKPIHSNVQIPFGLKKYSPLSRPQSLVIDQYSLFHKGHTFSVTNNDERIQAIGPGKVIFSDVLPYWGESIIVQHEGNYFSIYAGMKNINLEIGQLVASNEILGQSKNSEFYFELRHGSIPINPKNWIKDFK